MSLKRKVAFSDEDETEYRGARASAKLDELGEGPTERDATVNVSSDAPLAKTKHTLDSDEEDNADDYEKLQLDDIAGRRLAVV